MKVKEDDMNDMLNDVSTQFYGFDWNSSGWDGDALIMKNGARIVVNALPFDGGTADPAATGKPTQFEMNTRRKGRKALDEEVMNCIFNEKGGNA